jgi:hypothetical protein
LIGPWDRPSVANNALFHGPGIARKGPAMKRRPSPDSPRRPLDSTADLPLRRRPGVASAIGVAAVSAVLVGLGTPASSAPRSAEAQQAVVAVVSENQVEPGRVTPLPAPDPVEQPPAEPPQPEQPPAEQPQPAQQPAEQPQPAQPPAERPQPAQQPAEPGTPASPVADLRRASAAFEAAAGKASAPGARQANDPDALPPMPDFTGVAAGVALGELQARFDEFANNEWVQTGSIQVAGTERVEVVSIGGVPTHRFSTCVDSSGIEIRDSAGAVVLAAVPAGTRKAINTYDIQQQKGTWVVVGHSFPDSAAC